MRISVLDLIDQPGRSREVATAVTAGDDDLSWGPAEDALDGPIRVDLQLDAVTDGIVARGTVSFPLEVPCARCLSPQRDVRRIEVAELFRDPRRITPEEEAEDAAGPDYRITDDLTAIDLTQLLHDTVVMHVPFRILCREDCQGLCPRCGADRNTVDCGHDGERPPDPRWAKLAELDLPESRG